MEGRPISGAGPLCLPQGRGGGPEAQGLLERVEAHRHSVGHCYRCKTVVEPNLSRQWFVKAKPLAEKAIEAVETAKPASSPNRGPRPTTTGCTTSRLVHFPPDLVGPPDSGLDLSELQKDDRGHGRAGRLPGLRLQRPGPGNRCAGHLVQLGPVALLHHGMAGPRPSC
jgi:hypothetical protein